MHYVLVLMAVAIVAILAAVVIVAMGQGGEMAHFPNDFAPPEFGALAATDVALLRPPTALWGYHMQATDEALNAIALALSERDVRIASLERQLSDLRGGSPEGLTAPRPPTATPRPGGSWPPNAPGGASRGPVGTGLTHDATAAADVGPAGAAGPGSTAGPASTAGPGSGAARHARPAEGAAAARMVGPTPTAAPGLVSGSAATGAAAGAASETGTTDGAAGGAAPGLTAARGLTGAGPGGAGPGGAGPGGAGPGGAGTASTPGQAAVPAAEPGTDAARRNGGVAPVDAGRTPDAASTGQHVRADQNQQGPGSGSSGTGWPDHASTLGPSAEPGGGAASGLPDWPGSSGGPGAPAREDPLTGPHPSAPYARPQPETPPRPQSDEEEAW